MSEALNFVPKFEGSDDVNITTFISAYEEAKNLINPTDKTKFNLLVSGRIVGKAKERLRESVFEFGEKINRTYQRLIRAVESDTSYDKEAVDTMKILFKKKLIKYFTNGLKESIEVRMSGKSFTNLEDAIDSAVECEAIVNERQFQHENVITTSITTKRVHTIDHHEKVRERSPLRKCSICKKPGHKEDMCWFREPECNQKPCTCCKMENHSFKFCRNYKKYCELCRKRGHTRDYCRSNPDRKTSNSGKKDQKDKTKTESDESKTLNSSSLH